MKGSRNHDPSKVVGEKSSKIQSNYDVEGEKTWGGQSQTAGIAAAAAAGVAVTTTTTEAVDKRKLFVANIPDEVHERALERFFSQFGALGQVSIWRERANKRSLGKGVVEFLSETSALKCLEAARSERRLVLDGNNLVVDFLKRNPKPPRMPPQHQQHSPRHTQPKLLPNCNHHHHHDHHHPQNDKTSFEKLDSRQDENAQDEIHIHINELPYQILISIFSNLCIRDLCTAEKVCRKWYQLVREAWRYKTSISFDEKSIYDGYSKKENRYGFECRPAFEFGAFEQVMRKKFGSSLKHIDMSGLANKLTNHGAECLDLIGYECPNVEKLVLSGLNISNKPFGKCLKYLKHVRELDISNCYRINDTGLARVFDKCHEIASINVSFCDAITGSCFESTRGRLETVVIDGCQIQDEFLLVLAQKNPQLRVLSMRNSKINESCTILQLFKLVPELDTLRLSDSGLNCLIGKENVNFGTLKTLKRLEIDGSRCDNKIVADILTQCTSLTHLNIGYCMGLSDEMFSLNSHINAPLEELNMAFQKQITDSCLEIISHELCSLKRLVLKGCSKLTNEGLTKLLCSLPKLTSLDIRFINKVDNTILEAALNLNTRIHVLCSDTNIDPIKFVYNHEATTKTNLDQNLFAYTCGLLTFEALATKHLRASRLATVDDDDIWDDDFYLGSDSDLDDYFPGYVSPQRQQQQLQDRPLKQQSSEQQSNASAKPLVLDLDYYDDDLGGDFDDEDDEDDFDDFINNEPTEMYNELDEY